MASDGDGLRFRVEQAARQIQTQHERLDPMLADLRRALTNGDSRHAQNAAFRLDGAMRAHFLLEEYVLFPALRGIQPETEGQLEMLEQDHVRVGGALRAVIDQILESQLDQAAKILTDLASTLAAHERHERSLLEALVRESAS
jgi:iron-sulfur cluster repair protein YtfE (RIC family)